MELICNQGKKARKSIEETAGAWAETGGDKGNGPWEELPVLCLTGGIGGESREVQLEKLAGTIATKSLQCHKKLRLVLT